MQRVKSGDPFPLASAEALNEVADVVQQVNGRRSKASRAGRPGRPANLVPVKSHATQTLTAPAVVILHDAPYTKEQSPDRYQYDPELLADIPATDVQGIPAVLLDTLEPGGYGEAMIAGLITLTVDVKSVNHRHARPLTGDVTKLESAATGPFQIIAFPTATVATGAQLCAVQFPAPAGYDGYFAVVPWGADAVRVLDGSASADDTAGPALINGEEFSVAAENISYGSGTTYIWLQATSTDSTINNPTIESGSSAPGYETGKCKILLARVIAGRVVQEHTGAVQGIIWGDCDSGVAEEGA